MFNGKKYLILGVANERSIAWSIASALHAQGAELAFTFVNEAIEKRVRPLAESIGCRNVFPCDVQSDEQITSLCSALGELWGGLDGILHSVAFAERDDLQKRFCDTSRQGFHLALDVSAYSLIAVAGKARALMQGRNASILTLTYLGSEKVVTNYNIMGVAKAALESSMRYLAADLGGEGIRVNAISAGPIKTLAASGIPHFKEMLAAFAEKAPLRRAVSLEDVANTAMFYMGPMSSGVTGEITFVDCGFNIMGI